ncbi:uncharacterized protein PAN0_007d3290 [Moesziomyces antarcticus]|uniref:Uncharacterized protein n=2 Tax=Pseudozyma antarctica TaxID=84753 RepID=A0A5C3FYC5_PSEA2|nr:uncharacterized protein PAN0_007d3290 [Moesziomyces antarcticus]GAK65073.1 hypothetical protein PAN0_007d3290 [Moesziomyces antarcticus]SPO49338.1 uncharacterized protein PSANT_07030 [Moesziomyces antarcticus]
MPPKGRRSLMRCVTRTLARTVSGVVPTGGRQSPYTAAGVEGGLAYDIEIDRARSSSLKAEVSSDGTRALTEYCREGGSRWKEAAILHPSDPTGVAASIGKDFF